MKTSLIYITTPGPKEAKSIAKALLKERLIACANIMNGAESLYWWQGKINTAKETVLIAKTRAKLVNKAIARARALHPYECPCIVSLPIEGGHPPFLAWIEGETSH